MKLLKVNKNISYHPTLKRKLTQLFIKCNDAIKEGNFSLALHYIEQLLPYKYNEAETIKLQLLCFMKLQFWDELEMSSEALLQRRNHKDFTLYLYYYIVSLFNNHEYIALIEAVKENRKYLCRTSPFKKKVKTIENKTYEKIKKQATQLIEEIKRAVLLENKRLQWQLFQQWKNLQTKTPALFLDILKDDRVHPLLKTEIIQTLQKEKKEGVFQVKKGKDMDSFSIQQLPPLKMHPIYKKAMKLLREKEEQNPTLYELAKQLLTRYCKIYYPFLHSQSETPLYVQTVRLLAHNHLTGEATVLKDGKNIDEIRRKIETGNEQYLTLLID